MPFRVGFALSPFISRPLPSFRRRPETSSRHSGAGRKRPPVIPAQAGNQKGFIEILNSGYRVGVRHDGKDVEHFYTGYRIKSGMTRMDRGPV